MDSSCSDQSQWSLVGVFRKRPVPQGEVVDFASSLEDQCNEDAPILIYDMNRLPEESSRVPRYIAKKISIPPPSVQDMKVISFAPPATSDLEGQEPILSLDCSEFPTRAAATNKSQSRGEQLLLMTVLPQPSHIYYLIPLLLFLADIAVLVCSMTLLLTSKKFIAACCVLVIVPDVLTLGLILKKGVYSTTLAVYLVLGTDLILVLFLQPFVSILLILHILLSVVMLLFVLRLRKSLYSSSYVLR